jgi:enoyl-CoA hydratase
MGKYYRIEKENPVATLFIDFPEKHNALNPETMQSLMEALDLLAADDSVRVVIVTGSGNKSFTSGVELDRLVQFEDTSQAREFAFLLDKTLDRFLNFPKPIIAAINGYALGAGLSVAISCDIRVIADSAKVGFPAVRIGAILPMGCTLRLVSLIGRGRALDLLLSGRMLSAKEAEEFGMAEYIVSADQLMTKAREIAAHILEGSDLALSMTKQVTNHLLNIDLTTYRNFSADNFAFLSTTKDWNQRISAYLNKEK